MSNVKSMMEARHVFGGCSFGSAMSWPGSTLIAKPELDWIEIAKQHSGPLADCHVDHSGGKWWWQSPGCDLLVYVVVTMMGWLGIASR